MAEPVSSIVTLATVSLQIIRETTRFIQEAKVVDLFLQKLVASLQNLGRLIEIIDLTNHEAQPTEDGDDPFVQETLARCRQLLENVQSMVEPFATERTQTFWEKAALNLRLSRSRQNIQTKIQDIGDLITQMNVAINCRT